ncbi:MAG: mechanosensitive ion channel [Pseudomonadota bacterium]
MENVYNTIETQLGPLGPIVMAAIILGITYVIAKLVSAGLTKGVDALNLEKTEGDEKPQLGKSVGMAGFWLVILFGLVAALDKLGLDQVTSPLRELLNTIMGYLPQIVGAALIMAMFTVVAIVVKRASTAVLKFADGLPERANLASGPVNISGITGTVLFAVLILFGISAALGELGIEAISEPVSGLVDAILGAIPNIIVALIVLGLFLFIGKFVTDLIRKTLPNTGVDKAVAELGLLKGADGGMTASSIIANVVMFLIVLVGLVQAVRLLEFEILTEYMDVILTMAAQIVFGAVIIAAGVFLANLVSKAMASTGSGATDTAAGIVKWIIIGLSLILGISRMGLDPTGGEFVLDVAKLLAMGAAVGVAGALAIGFGWGGRDWFGKQLEKWKSAK